MNKQNIIYKKTKDIIPYDKNPRKNDEAVKYVAESIKEFGFKVPIIIDSNNVIVAGHTRLKASKLLKIDEVPCIIADDLNEEQIKAFRLADNKVSEFAEWDFELLSEELDNILNIKMSDFGFDLSLDLPTEEKEIEEDEFDVEIPEEPKAKYGDIYQLGNHRLMCGDSTKEEDVAKLMDGQVADMVVTDPPYNVAYEGKTKDKLTINNDSMKSNEFLDFLTICFKNLNDSLKSGGSFYVWYASKEHINFETALNNNNLDVREQLIWVKNSLVLSRQDYHWRHEPCLYGWKDGEKHNWFNDRKQTTVLEFDRPTANKEHPTMKPVKLISYLINNSSKEDEIILDLFGGSGTTLIASEQLDRKCYMMELDAKYVDVIIARWEQFTGKKAVLINGDDN